MSIPGRRTFVDRVGGPGEGRRPRVPRWTPRPVISGRLDRKSSWEGVGLGGGGTLPAKSPGGPEGIAGGGGGHTTPLTQGGDGCRRMRSDTRYIRAAGLIDHQCTHLLLCSGVAVRPCLYQDVKHPRTTSGDGTTDYRNQFGDNLDERSRRLRGREWARRAGRSSPTVLGDDRQQGGPVLVDLGRPDPAHPGQLGDRRRA